MFLSIVMVSRRRRRRCHNGMWNTAIPITDERGSLIRANEATHKSGEIRHEDQCFLFQSLACLLAWEQHGITGELIDYCAVATGRSRLTWRKRETRSYLLNQWERVSEREKRIERFKLYENHHHTKCKKRENGIDRRSTGQSPQEDEEKAIACNTGTRATACWRRKTVTSEIYDLQQKTSFTLQWMLFLSRF